MVDELVTLVATVLIPAAKIEAMSSPVSPTGSSFTMKNGNTKSAPIPSGNKPGFTL